VKGESIFEINDPVKAIYIIKNGEFIVRRLFKLRIAVFSSFLNLLSKKFWNLRF